MYRLLFGNISDHDNAKAAGRALLAAALAPSPLPEIACGRYGKPGFAAGVPLWFNISHSGDHIVLLLSDEGEVGCDMEVVRPRKNAQRIAEAVFSPGEKAQLAAAGDNLIAFWQIWTAKEAMLKQTGGQIGQIAQFDSCAPAPLHLAQFAFSQGRMVALCTPTKLSLQFNNNDVNITHKIISR